MKLTSSQVVEVSEKRTALKNRLTALRAVQAIYMPIVTQLLAQHSTQPRATSSGRRTVWVGDSDSPKHQPLFLPHALTPEQRNMCTKGLNNIEKRLREGQLRNSLDTLRVHLHIKSRLLRYKTENVRHQAPNTRAHEKLDMNENKIVLAAEKYRKAWVVMKSYNTTAVWQELKRQDVRCLQVDHGRGESEGHRTVSWIWQSTDCARGDNSDSEDDHGLKEGMYEC